MNSVRIAMLVFALIPVLNPHLDRLYDHPLINTHMRNYGVLSIHKSIFQGNAGALHLCGFWGVAKCLGWIEKLAIGSISNRIRKSKDLINRKSGFKWSVLVDVFRIFLGIENLLGLRLLA